METRQSMEKGIWVCAQCNISLERLYVEEWCRHYFGIGADKIVLLDDVDAPGNGGESLSRLPYVAEQQAAGRIEVREVKGHPMQNDVISSFYRGRNGEFDWCCVFDCDEFLVLKRHASMGEWLREVGAGADVVQVPWLNYGDQGVVRRDPKGSAVEAFMKEPTYKARVENKVVVRGGMRSPKFFIGHACADDGGRRVQGVVDGSGRPVGRFDPFVQNPDYSTACLAHLFTKSTEEFIRRRLHGRADTRNPLEWTFAEHRKIYFTVSASTPEKEAMFDGAEMAVKHFSGKH